MNDSIEKLFDQALAEFTAENKYATVVVPDPIQRDFVEKFAELIVQECCDLIMKNQYNMVPGFMERMSAYSEVCMLKEHFGVEE